MSGQHAFDLCVLGGGSAGFAGANAARGLGKTAAIVDGTGPLAGLCILRGCMPSKTLIRSAEIAHLMRVAPTLGVTPSGVRIDVPAMVARKRRIIGEFADERIKGLERFPLFRGAQYLVRVGVDTTLVQRGARLLSGEDPDVGETLRRALEADGIRVHTGALVHRVERYASGKQVIARTADGELTVEAEDIFAALGRRPNVEGFGFDVAGISYDAEGVKIDEYMRTTNPRIFAAGDATGMNELVHVAVYGGALAAANAFSASPRRLNADLWASRAVFTDPQVGIAGLTERQCHERGIPYEVASYPFNELGKAITAELTQGYVKMLAALDGRIVGAEASDLIHEAIVLVYFGARCHDVMEMPHLHPTLAEIITYPAEELCEKIEHQRYAVVTP